MRGSYTGALELTYLHSVITRSLWYAVAESERMFCARLSHAVMLASLYGNPSASLDKGNDQIHTLYIGALEAMPYFKRVAKSASKSENDALVDEWRKANSEAVQRGGHEEGSGARGKDGDDGVR